MGGLYLTERDLAEMLRGNPALRINQRYSQPKDENPESGQGKSEKLKNLITPEEIVPYEDDEQIEIAGILDEFGLLWTHPPNGGYRDFKTAKLLRRMGVKPGVPDIVIFTPPPVFPGRPGTVIEMKRRLGGKVSKYQKEWLAALRELNWYTAVARGAAEAVQVLRECGYIT